MRRAGHGVTRVRVLLIGAALVCLLLTGLASTASARVIPTDKGPLRGVETAAMNKYLGIPYAAEPVGDLRFRPPQAVARWHGVRDASQVGPHCPQEASPFGQASTTEDCLYLNVYTPSKTGPPTEAVAKNGKVKKAKHKRLPVMVWIHGGALVVGESDEYDPTRLVEQGAIVVTINYRLGWLGFLAHPALTAESPDHTSGNYGLMDQQAALQWVQRNIKRFGGDADNVTIFGESAGGLSVHAQLASPLAAGLFDRAIAQSGSYSSREPSLADAESRGLLAAHQSGCSESQTAECLRSIPVDALLASQPELPGEIGPNVDGKVLPQRINTAIQNGEFNRVPVVEGTTHDEFTLFAYTNIQAVFGPLPAFFYPIAVPLLVSQLGLNTDPSAVLAQYPLGNYSNNTLLALSVIATDAVFACPAHRITQALSGWTPTYQYEFADPNAPQLFVPPAAFPYGAYHGSEVQYLFNVPDQQNAPDLNADQQSLANAMVRYWTTFAGTGNPNGAGVPQWPLYTTATHIHQSLEPPTPKSEDNFAADHKCAFWDAQ